MNLAADVADALRKLSAAERRLSPEAKAGLIACLLSSKRHGRRARRVTKEVLKQLKECKR